MFPAFWLVLWLAGLQVRPALPPTPASIQGVVVRAGAGAASSQGLPDARVELRPGNRSVFTGADGAFTFRNVAPGSYTLFFTRDGFIPQEDRKRGLTVAGLSVTVAAGQTLKDVALPMIPAPVIAGKVIDSRGFPLATALVRAYRRRYTQFGPQLKIIKKGMTNDLGEFRLFGLNFGDYLISAGYSDRDRAAAVGKTQLSENVAKADEGYATVFYDGGEDISLARAAHLAPGFDPGMLNIYLADPPRLKIRGQVLPQVPGTKIAMVPKGSDLADATDFIEPTASGAFEIRGVSRGSYVLHAKSADPVLFSNVIEANVTDTDIDGVRLVLQETTSISGRIVQEGSPRANLSGLTVRLLRSSIEFEQKVDAPASPDGTFTLDEVVASAEYDISIESAEPLPTGTYVKSIRSGGRSVLPGKSLLLRDQPLEIVLATVTEPVELHVTKANDPAVGMEVVLIPDPSLRRRADRYFNGFTDESGNLRLVGIPMGRYTAYAFERIEPGEYYALAYSPAAENRFRDRAATVIVTESGTKAVQLTVIPAAETVGGLQ